MPCATHLTSPDSRDRIAREDLCALAPSSQPIAFKVGNGTDLLATRVVVGGPRDDGR